jgi:hypothetical protein
VPSNVDSSEENNQSHTETVDAIITSSTSAVARAHVLYGFPLAGFVRQADRLVCFYDVEDLEITGFSYQNVVQDLVVTADGDRWKIHAASLFGADFSLTCAKAEVANVAPPALRPKTRVRRKKSLNALRTSPGHSR